MIRVAPVEDRLLRVVTGFAASKVTLVLAGMLTAATLAPSGIAPPAQLPVEDHKPDVPPVQLTEASWVMNPPTLDMTGDVKP